MRRRSKTLDDKTIKKTHHCMRLQVPSLEIDGLVLTQSVAIMEYIADRSDHLKAPLTWQ